MMPFAAMRLARGPAVIAGGPAPISVTDTQYLTTGTARAVNMPAAVAAGDLLVIDVMFRSTGGVTTVYPPVGWAVVSDVIRTGNVFRKLVCYKIANGTEGGTTVNFTVNTAANMAASVFRFAAGTFSGIPFGIGTHGSSVSPASPLLTPPYGVWPYTWYSTNGNNGAVNTVYPLPSGQGQHGNGSNNQLGYSYTQSAAASLTPGAFTLSTARDWVAHTWAVPGPGLPNDNTAVGWDLATANSLSILEESNKVVRAAAGTSGTYARFRSSKALTGKAYGSGVMVSNAGFGIGTLAFANYGSNSVWPGTGVLLNESIGIYLNSEIYWNGVMIHDAGPATTPATWEYAVDVPTRKVWLRQSGQPWPGGGDPETGVNPHGILNGVDPIHVVGVVYALTAAGRSMRIHHLAEITGTPPVGYTKANYAP